MYIVLWLIITAILSIDKVESMMGNEFSKFETAIIAAVICIIIALGEIEEHLRRMKMKL